MAASRIVPSSYILHGFTLVEMLISVTLITSLAAFILPILQQHVQNARLKQAQVILMENARFLEHFYAQNTRFTLNSTMWPTLPITETEYYAISFAGTARGTRVGTYRLQALPKNTMTDTRYAIIDQNHVLQVCWKQNNSTLCEIP